MTTQMLDLTMGYPDRVRIEPILNLLRNSEDHDARQVLIDPDRNGKLRIEPVWDAEIKSWSIVDGRLAAGRKLEIDVIEPDLEDLQAHARIGRRVVDRRIVSWANVIGVLSILLAISVGLYELLPSVYR